MTRYSVLLTGINKIHINGTTIEIEFKSGDVIKHFKLCKMKFSMLSPTSNFDHRADESTVCPTRYRTRHLFNNSNTNEDIETKFEQE